MRRANGNLDVIILGGGPAGLSAAMWCDELGMASLVFEEKPELGGQLHWIHVPIKNYPGIDLKNGTEFLERLMAQLRDRKFEIRKNAKITEVDLGERVITLASRETVAGRAIVIATGIRRHKLGVENEDSFAGRGILETGQINRNDLRGKNLLIVGGGDAAFENPHNLSAFPQKIYLLHRTSSFAARPEFVERVINNPRVELILNAKVTDLFGDGRLQGVRYADRVSKGSAELNVDSLLVRIGVEPNSSVFPDLRRDDKGYILIDHRAQTSLDRIFAIGDVANPLSPTISTAAGTGSTAAKAIFNCLKG